MLSADRRRLEVLHQVLVHVRDLGPVAALVRSGEAFESALEQTQPGTGSRYRLPDQPCKIPLIQATSAVVAF
jgi:hypothetical protein